MSFFSKFFSKKEKQEVLDNGLQTTKTSFFDKLSHAIAGKSKVDDDVLDELENVLVTSDVVMRLYTGSGMPILLSSLVTVCWCWLTREWHSATISILPR